MSDPATKSDEHGEYHPDAGSPHPVSEEDVDYVPCNAVLRYTFDRYGERRYCTAMAIENFTKHGVDTDYEHPDFCKNHQSRAALMKQHEENFKTGAHAKSHEHIFQHMPPHKQLLANDLYKSLLDESTYAFDAEEVELEIDVADNDFAPDADVLVLDHPVPTEHKVRGKALWFAAVDFVTMQAIKEEQFRVAAEETVEGRKLVVGETRSVVATDDDFTEVADEHHLNIHLSRITKDYKEHMKFGGVTYDADDEGGDMQTREWVAVVEPDEESPAPETASSDVSPMDDIEIPDDAD